jgi:hypothetical protein
MKDGVDFSNGYAFIGGPAFNDNADAVATFNKSCKIIDLGGTCGKVLAVTFKGSEFNSVAQEITGNDYGLVDYSDNVFPIFYWVPNPEVMKAYAKGGDNKTLRVRIEANIYSKSPSTSAEIFKAYVNDDENNVQPVTDNEAPDILITEAEFAKRWCDTDEAEFDEDVASEPSVWDDGDVVWYPNRWLVYEFDFGVAAQEGDEWNYAPKIKMEVPGGNSYNDFAILFRNIQFYEPASGCDIATKTRSRKYNNYTLGAVDNNGVHNVALDNNSKLEVSVNGNIASFSENATVYNFAGARVAAGRNVSLANGVYVANANGKAVKFVVR